MLSVSWKEKVFVAVKSKFRLNSSLVPRFCVVALFLSQSYLFGIKHQLVICLYRRDKKTCS